MGGSLVVKDFSRSIGKLVGMVVVKISDLKGMEIGGDIIFCLIDEILVIVFLVI